MVKNLSAMQEMQVWSLGREDCQQEQMAIHSSILAWEIPWTEEVWQTIVHGVAKGSDTTEQLMTRSNDWCPCKKRGRGTQQDGMWRWTNRCLLETDTRVMLPQAKECQKPPEAGKGQEESSPRALRGAQPCWYLGFVLLASRMMRE